MGGWERSIENTKIGQRQPRAGKFTVLESASFESTGNMVVGGDLHVTGSMIVTASVLHEGSNIFGDEATDTHKFIGVTTASGDLTVNTDLHVKTNASIDGTLDVSGITHLRSNASLDSDLDVAGNIVAGNIAGLTPPIIKKDSCTLLASECKGQIILCASTMTLTAPSVFIGALSTVRVTTATKVHVKMDASDRLNLSGVAMDDGDKATSPGTAGAQITIWGDSADGWTEIGMIGGWVDGGA